MRLALGADGAAVSAVDCGAVAPFGGVPSASVLGASIEGWEVLAVPAVVSSTVAFCLRGLSLEGDVMLYFVVMRV